MSITIYCPGPVNAGPGTECCEGALWLPGDDATDPNSPAFKRDCPRCEGTGKLELPSRLEVCDRCEGKGTHVNEAIDGNGITASEMDELGPDFLEDYMGGVYDVRCTECKGRNVMPVVDEGRCSEELLEAYHEERRSESDFRREQEAERRMGA